MSLQNKIDAQRYAGKIVALVLSECAKLVQVGNTPLDIDQKAHHLTVMNGCIPSCLNYHGFPASICVSVNDAVVHGIPSARPFQDGDVVKLDFACHFQGYHADAALTTFAGTPSVGAVLLAETTYKALLAGIAEIGPGVSTKKITQAIQNTLQGTGLYAAQGFAGHTIGRQMHMSPLIHNYHDSHSAYSRLRVGQTIAVEPIVVEGAPEVVRDPDGQTYRSANGQLAAQFEHTVLVTEEGFEILTPWSSLDTKR